MNYDKLFIQQVIHIVELEYEHSKRVPKLARSLADVIIDYTERKGTNINELKKSLQAELKQQKSTGAERVLN